MKRKLLKQMRNEWRDNIWLILSLMIVFTVVWGSLYFAICFSYGYFLPRGYDCENVYTINVNAVKDNSPYYKEGAEETKEEDLGVLIKRLRALPSVEAVMFHYYALPYYYNYYGTRVIVPSDTSILEYYGNARFGSPDIVDVIRLKSITGATSEQLKEMLRKGEILISEDEGYYRPSGGNPLNLKGKMVQLSSDTTKLYRVGDVIENVRRNDYEPASAGTVILPLEEDKPNGTLAVRVKPGMGKKLEEEFRDNKDLRVNGNILLTELTSMEQIKQGNQRSIEVKIRQLIIVIFFVMLTAFLGLLGTFWFRVQQRVGEIAIRKVCGATNSQIIQRILGEGFVLLACAVIVVSAIMWIYFIPGFKESIGSESRWIIWAELGAIVLMGIGIVLSLLYPSRRAVKIEPAVAVKAE